MDVVGVDWIILIRITRTVQEMKGYSIYEYFPVHVPFIYFYSREQTKLVNKEETRRFL